MDNDVMVRHPLPFSALCALPGAVVTRDEARGIVTVTFYGLWVGIQDLTFGYFPKIFSIDGMRHIVTRVERVWTTGGEKKLGRHYFELTCEDGTFQIYQDLKSNTWHLERAMIRQSHHVD